MKLIIAVCFSIGFLFSSLSLAEDVKSAIESRNKEWANAFNRGDIEFVLTIYDDGFSVYPSGGEPITSLSELKQSLIDFKKVAKNLFFETISVRVVNNYAYELGKSHYVIVKEDGSEIVPSEEYLVIWKKGSDGVWYYHMDAYWTF